MKPGAYDDAKVAGKFKNFKCWRLLGKPDLAPMWLNGWNKPKYN